MSNTKALQKKTSTSLDSFNSLIPRQLAAGFFIDGFLADTVFQTGKEQVIRIPDEERIREVSRQIKALDEPKTEDPQAVTSFWMHTKIFFLRHSLLTNISNALFKKVLPEKHSPSTENLRTSI